MHKLNRNWFAEGLMDFEYKKYLLLGYLQGVKARFGQSLLFPEFQELIQHLNDLRSFQANLADMRTQFPKNLQGIDPDPLQLRYASALEPDASLSEIESIVAFATPRIQEHAEEGRELYDLIEENITIESVGLLPLTRDAGYLLLRRGAQQEVSAYQYQTTIFEQANERYRGIHVQFVCSFAYHLGSSFESIKLALVRQNRSLPNPATYSVQARLEFPEAESIVPVTKRKFMRHLAQEGWT